MKNIGETIQSGDWKGEKHVPVIHAPEKVKKGEAFEIKAIVGEKIPHPNTLEHHICWIKIFFQPKDAKFPIEIGNSEFSAHGESEIYNEPSVSLTTKIDKSGTIHALSYCNIHGLWENSIEISVE
ncbi:MULTISPECIES: class II SORL domain-containing protein [Tissierellales]|jgi:superoxide reductase|uniref:Superoxide reductase n=1 Tax=Acidilutibacter cellobiosedens TaxID=2507161 RepID=A0A410QFS7_9FIRM|nr:MULTISPECIES: class II SORL domain-containing protein [Tissierellales]MBE6082206.1 superoxide reductase [Tissierellaceae bacterium]QAT62786.1 superoxide reductase [Acidilutibacter cellobiosedens]SCL95522.1 putative superoxide reductase [Sporanaerobacter sp. PP17-6a]